MVKDQHESWLTAAAIDDHLAAGWSPQQRRPVRDPRHPPFAIPEDAGGSWRLRYHARTIASIASQA